MSRIGAFCLKGYQNKTLESTQVKFYLLWHIPYKVMYIKHTRMSPDILTRKCKITCFTFVLSKVSCNLARSTVSFAERDDL